MARLQSDRQLWWHLKNALGSGNPDGTFPYGGPGDIPVVDDWDGKRTWTIGVKRGKTWHFKKNTNESGMPSGTLDYEGGGDLPIMGKWQALSSFNQPVTVGVYRLVGTGYSGDCEPVTPPGVPISPSSPVVAPPTTPSRAAGRTAD